MKEEILKHYEDYILAFSIWQNKIFNMGGLTSKRPDLQGFMDYLKFGYITD